MEMKGNGTCVAVNEKPKDGGKWELLVYGTESSGEKLCVIKAMNNSGRYLYLESNGKEVRGERNTDKISKKGLWKILPVPNQVK